MPENKRNQVNKQWDASSIKAVIGLGNPGAEYKNTYHNVGATVISWLCDNDTHDQDAPKTVKGFFKYCKGGERIWAESLVFMNESGTAVKRLLGYFNLRAEEILVVHDDSDLQIWRLKLSWNRGSAGHKGVESVLKNLGTKKLWRLRVGIRHEGTRQKASAFVLKKISATDKRVFAEAVKKFATSAGLTGKK